MNEYLPGLIVTLVLALCAIVLVLGIEASISADCKQTGTFRASGQAFKCELLKHEND